jgi:hypothetical protein
MTLERPSRRQGIVRFGGGALLFAAIAFVVVFVYLAAAFDYPEVLDGTAEQVLPALLEMGATGRAVWAFYALLPLLFLPGGVGAFQALRPAAEGWMRLAMLLAAVSAVASMLGLMRWPSVHWELAGAYGSAGVEGQRVIGALFEGLNRYLGNFIGEFLGELCFNAFFLISALAMLRPASGFARWVGWLGIVTASLGLVGMFRNAVGFVEPIAEVNNYLLPIWLGVFGVALLRHRAEPAQRAAHADALRGDLRA